MMKKNEHKWVSLERLTIERLYNSVSSLDNVERNYISSQFSNWIMTFLFTLLHKLPDIRKIAKMRFSFFLSKQFNLKFYPIPESTWLNHFVLRVWDAVRNATIAKACFFSLLLKGIQWTENFVFACLFVCVFIWLFVCVFHVFLRFCIHNHMYNTNYIHRARCLDIFFISLRRGVFSLLDCIYKIMWVVAVKLRLFKVFLVFIFRLLNIYEREVRLKGVVAIAALFIYSCLYSNIYSTYPSKRNETVWQWL